MNMTIETLPYLTDEEKKILLDLASRIRAFLSDRLVRIVLFGSKARGDFQNDSDIDVAIIVKDLDRKLKDEIYTIVAKVEYGYLRPIASIAFSEEHFDDLLERERRIVRDIQEEGITIKYKF